MVECRLDVLVELLPLIKLHFVAHMYEEYVCVFCRVICQINRDSTNYIVEEYKRLRQRDQTGAAKSAWRITVRQLESMIRLSEGIARMYCQDEVSLAFTVTPVFR